MALSINDQDIQCEVWRNHLNKVQWKPVQPGFGLVQSWNLLNVTRGSHGLIHPAIPQGLPVWENQPSTSSCSHHLCLLRMILSETAGVQPWISRERNEKRMEKDSSAAMEFDWWMDPTGNCLLNALWYRVGRGVTTCDNLSRPDQKIKTSLRKGGERDSGILRWIFYIQIRNLFFLSEDIRTTRNTKTTQFQNVDIIPTIHTLLGWPHRNHLKTLQSTLMKAQRRQTVLSLRAQIEGI